jgi:hypothetical protein
VALPAGTTIQITLGLTPTSVGGTVPLVNRNSGKLLDSPGGSGQGAALDQSTDTNSNQSVVRLVPTATSGYYRLVSAAF